MRDFKFRAWDKDEKVMYENENIRHINFNDKVIILNVDGYDFIGDFEDDEDGNVVVMEYTGLMDRNDKDVYEGDLIPYHFNEDIKGIVKYGEYRNPCEDEQVSHRGFYVYWEDDRYKNSMRKDLGYWLRYSFVDGNIYETN